MGLLDSLFSGSQGSGGLLDFLSQQPSSFADRFNALPAGPNQPSQLDNAQWPSGPIGVPASFADRFNAMPGAPQPFTPSGRQFNSASFDPATYAPNQATPIAVGNYQMPRLGGADQYIPQQSAALPQNAQPTQGQLPPQAPAQMVPQQSPQPQQSLPPALGGIGSSLGRAFNPDGLIARLTGNDSRSVAQQNLKAQYEALVPMVGQQKAMLAVLNPEAGKTILAQALEKKNYGFTKLDDGTIVRQDPQTGKVETAYGSERPSAIAGPDGKMIEMPVGADPKTWRNEITKINADVAAGKKTEVQAKAEIFGNKMELSNKSISDNVGTSLAGKIASGIPLGNYVQSPEYQKYKAASSNFITALLRQESGAAISNTEFDRYEREYMPQPGDGPEVLANKAEARRVAIEGMKKGAGPGYKPPTESGFKTQTGISWSVVK